MEPAWDIGIGPGCDRISAESSKTHPGVIAATGRTPFGPAVWSGQPVVREALQWWRNLAGHARALLNVGAQLFKGRIDDLTLARLNPELLLSALRLRSARRNPAAFVAYGMELWLRLFQERSRAIRARPKLIALSHVVAVVFRHTRRG